MLTNFISVIIFILVHDHACMLCICNGCVCDYMMACLYTKICSLHLVRNALWNLCFFGCIFINTNLASLSSQLWSKHIFSLWYVCHTLAQSIKIVHSHLYWETVLHLCHHCSFVCITIIRLCPVTATSLLHGNEHDAKCVFNESLSIINCLWYSSGLKSKLTTTRLFPTNPLIDPRNCASLLQPPSWYEHHILSQ